MWVNNLLEYYRRNPPSVTVYPKKIFNIKQHPQHPTVRIVKRFQISLKNVSVILRTKRFMEKIVCQTPTDVNWANEGR